MGLTVFLWEVQLIDRHDSTQKSWRYYIGLFDLNGWYLVKAFGLTQTISNEFEE